MAIKFVCRLLVLIMLCLNVGLPSWAQSGGKPGQAPASSLLSIDDVIKMSKAGLSNDIIIQQIKKRPKPFDLSPAQLIRLKSASVTDRVIEVMVGTPKAEAQPVPPPAPQEPPIKKLDAESMKFLTEECGVAPADVEVIPLLDKDQQASIASWISAKDCNKFAAFKQSREYFRSLKPNSAIPLAPGGWSITYLTNAEYQRYVKILDSAPW